MAAEPTLDQLVRAPPQNHRVPQKDRTMTRDELRHHFLRNALYHTARRRVLEARARWTNFIVLALGTAAAADVLGQFGISQSLLGLVIAVIAALQFAFDWAGRARTHEFLQRRYYEALAEIEARSEISDADCSAFDSRLALLAAEEPPTYRALESITYNEALDALYGKALAGDRIAVPVWHAALSQHVHFNGYNYRSVDELEALKQERRARRWWSRPKSSVSEP